MLLAAAACGSVRAQWSASVAVDSDHRFRGVSLSQGHPSARAGLGFDHASGAYGGAALAGVEPQPGRRAVQQTLYAGRAVPVGDGGLAAEAGLVVSRITGDGGRAYGSAYAGAIGDGWTLRLHLAPEDVWRGGRRTAYAEANGSVALASPGRLFWHLGALHTSAAAGDASSPQPGSGSAGLPAARPWRADLSVGAAVAWRNVELRAAWVAVQRDPPMAGTPVATRPAAGEYPTTSGRGRRSTLVISLALFL